MEEHNQLVEPLRKWAHGIKRIIRGDIFHEVRSLNTCPHCFDLNPDYCLQSSNHESGEGAKTNANTDSFATTEIGTDVWFEQLHVRPELRDYIGHWGFQSPVRAVLVIRTLSQFERTAQAGCEICKLLLAIRDFFHSTKQRLNLIVLVLPQLPATPQIFIKRQKGILNYEIQLYAPIGQNSPWGHIQPLPEISSDRLSANSLLFAKRCLSICLKDHKNCKRATARLPSRLLQVGKEEKDPIRLIETTGISTDTQYVALSYCWGRGSNIKTTADTYAIMQGGLMTSELPPAIHDAVLYTRALQVPFLWVDALCIIQEDQEDWERESGLMGDVYANALVTLAAECSSSVNEGFIQSTDELARLSTQPQNRFKTTMPQGKHRQVLLQARALPQYDHRETPPSTWSTRGWTLQERMLSTRLISFGYELKYMCQEALFNESCFLKERTNTALDGHKTLRAPKSQKEVFNLWQGIVEDYSRRSLTDCRDKLPAISGVAKVIHQNTSSVYLAGVWKSNIGRDLLWYSPAPAKDSITPSEVYLAPSFSWASISRPVYHDHHINAEENEWVQVVEILDCKVELVGPDHFGQVKSGYLTLSAPRIPTTIYPSLKSPGSINDFYAKPRWSIGVPEDLGVSELGDNVYGDFLYLDAAVQTIDTTNDDGEVETAACRLYEEEKAKDYLSSLDLQKHDTQHTSINTTPSTSASCWLLYIGVFVGETASTYEFLVLGKSPKRSHAYERLGMWSMPIEQNTSSVFKDKFHHMIQSAQTVEVTIV